MNNRIKQLIEQADIKFESHPQHQGIDTAVIIPTDLEKFAELIVKECASVIEKNHPEFSCKEAADNLYRKAGRMDAIDEILQHFGVEE